MSNSFERGFKAWCERLALEKRAELGVKAVDRLDPQALADNLKIKVRSIDQIPGLSPQTKQALVSGTDSSWSAVTICLKEKRLIVLNNSHSEGRLASDLAHELSHLLLEHKPAALDVSATGIMMLESYDQHQEEQANWLAGCLLLPRDALVHIKRRRIENSIAAKHFGVSLAMLRYRMSVTGVHYQYT